MTRAAFPWSIGTAARWAVAAALLLGGMVACGGPGSDDSPVVLRVSAAYGLSELAPAPQLAGSTAYAMDLVYDPLDRHVEVVEQNGTRVALRRRSTSPHGAAPLAAALRFQGLVSARASGEEIVCQLASSELVDSFVQNAGFDLGPFALAEQSPGRILLTAREPLGLDAIEILEIDGADEWRRLLGHELDVIPNAAALYRSQFDGMTSVRLVDIPPAAAAGLFFDTADPVLADPAVRRAIARVIDPVAVARVAGGDPGCAVHYWEVDPGPERAVLPAQLSLLVVDTENFLLAAKVVAHQLRAAGIDVEVEALSIEQVRERCLAGDFQLAVLGVAFPLEDAVQGRDDTAPVTRYRNQDLERARADGDLDTAIRILGEDVPILPLFELREFAGVDGAFCGGQPKVVYSWRWMADLCPCAEGER